MTTSVVAGGSVAGRTIFEQTTEALAALRPGYAKFYSMADLTTQSRRRWVPMDKAVSSGRVETMFRHYFAESGDRRFATFHVADAFAHGVLGRAMAGFVAWGRVWDIGAENLAVRTDIDGGLDWAGVRDTTLRVLPDDPSAGADGSVVLPCEDAVAHWLACRARPTLQNVFEGLSDVSSCRIDALWSTVGECVLGAATLIPTFAGTSPEVGYRRGQLVIDALHSSGLAVRSRSGLPRTPGAGPIPVKERSWRTFS